MEIYWDVAAIYTYTHLKIWDATSSSDEPDLFVQS